MTYKITIDGFESGLTEQAVKSQFEEMYATQDIDVIVEDVEEQAEQAEFEDN